MCYNGQVVFDSEKSTLTGVYCIMDNLDLLIEKFKEAKTELQKGEDLEKQRSPLPRGRLDVPAPRPSSTGPSQAAQMQSAGNTQLTRPGDHARANMYHEAMAGGFQPPKPGKLTGLDRIRAASSEPLKRSEKLSVNKGGQWSLDKGDEMDVNTVRKDDYDDKTNPGAIPMTADGVPVATARTQAAQPWRPGDAFAVQAPETNPAAPRHLPPQEARAVASPAEVAGTHQVMTEGKVKAPALVKPPTRAGVPSWQPSGVATPLNGTPTHIPPADPSPKVNVMKGEDKPNKSSEKLSSGKNGQWKLC